MAATQVFALTNNENQGPNAQGICTAASLAWAKAVLRRGSVNLFSDIGITEHALNAQMAILRKHDNDPYAQTEKAGLALVIEPSVNSIDDVIAQVKHWSPHVAIFWNSFHTMGYRYAHNKKEFFDMNTGLYRAKTTAEIKAKMEDVFRSKGYGRVEGCRIVNV